MEVHVEKYSMTKIFVSHATKDDEIVTRLHDALEAKTGHDLWVDHRDLKPPKSNWRKAIHEALQTCDAGLVVLSRNAVQRDEVVAEWNYLLNVQRQLYVAKLDDVPIEDVDYRLHIVQWVDLSRDLEAGIAALAAFMRGERPPEDAPLVLARPVTGVIDLRLTRIPISGRDQDISQVEALLRKGPTSILGVGGLGKSRLAAEIVMHSPDVQGAIWHTSSDVSHAYEVLELLRDHFGLEATASRQETLAPLRTHHRLIVIDNIESLRETEHPEYVRLIEELCAAGAQVLLTGRTEWDEIKMGQIYHPVQLPPDVAEKIVLDMQVAFSAPHDLRACAAEMARAARQHPGLIAWAVRQTRKFPPDKVIRDLQTLTSVKVQEALDEMIRKTLRQMTDNEGPETERALRRLAVCRGGFSYQAAQAILQVDNDTLDVRLETLQIWQFVTLRVVDNQTRYDVDALVLAAVGEDETAYRAHYDYYFSLAKQHDKKQDYAGLDVESANLETAFEWAKRSGDVEAAYWLANACGHFLENRGRFRQEVVWFERAAAALANHPDERMRGAVQNYLGNAYAGLAGLEDQADNLRRAIDAFHEAQRFYIQQNAPLAYAMTQNNLGSAYAQLAALEDRADNLRRAADAYREALRFYAPQSAPLDYATTQNNVGNAYTQLAALEDRAANLRRAADAYREALRFYTPQSAPLDHAMTQNNLGNAYRNLAALEDRGANLPRAIDAYREALRFWTPQSAPLGYAGTQANLGIAQVELGDLPAAIACWREAERYFRQMGAVEDADKMVRWIADAGG